MAVMSIFIIATIILSINTAFRKRIKEYWGCYSRFHSPRNVSHIFTHWTGNCSLFHKHWRAARRNDRLIISRGVKRLPIPGRSS